MEYEDGAAWIKRLLYELESSEISLPQFHAKLDLIKPALLRRAAGFEHSARNVNYIFKRVAAYAAQGRFETADRAAIRTELYLLETSASFEARAPRAAGEEGAPEK
jgi:hypothetical protein